MLLSLLPFVGLLTLLQTVVVFAAPAPASPARRWDDWGACTPDKMKIRMNFDNMAPSQRKAYTDAVKCLMAQPSQLDHTLYPAAINRYMDYAVIHVNRTQYVHLDAFFLTWHRYFLWLYETDLEQTCGYCGPFPYWDFASTASDPHAFPIFDGSEYSMGGDGVYNNTGPIILGPLLTIPHGTGGGCVTTGPFANMIAPIKFIDPSQLITGTLPPDAFAYNEICLMRDLNAYVSQTYTNQAELVAASHAVNASNFEFLLNGVIGSASLGIHSGAHFSVGGQMDSIHVSAQDPVWYPLHTMIDRVYWSWQINNPGLAETLDGTTGTALNTPPSAVVTPDSIEPDWGYFQLNPIQVKELFSTTGGPFCYGYDSVVS
jgi:tyrosinase